MKSNYPKSKLLKTFVYLRTTCILTIFCSRKLFDYAVVVAVVVSLSVPTNDATMNELSRPVRTFFPLIHDMNALVILFLVNSGMITTVFTIAKNSNRSASLEICIASNLWTFNPIGSWTLFTSVSLLFILKLKVNEKREKGKEGKN